jgi:hypothetical protein
MFSGKLVKKNGKLVYSDSKNKTLYDIFIKSLKEGEELDIFISVSGVKASTAQITKVHTCIRVIAMDLGYTFDEMKLIVKEQAGLKDRSFADCNKDEISLAIEACNCIAEDNGINLA